jgi:CopG family transcriptional regulator, nickel-responsive regulator
VKVRRFGVSLEEEVLIELDKLVINKQLPNRSRAIAYLVKDNLFSEKIDNNKDVAGSIVLVYDHHKRQLNSKLMDIQHDFHHIILSTQHVHLAHDLCLETIAVKGKAKELVDISNKIIGIKGIKHGKLVMTDID